VKSEVVLVCWVVGCWVGVQVGLLVDVMTSWPVVFSLVLTSHRPTLF
jgi:hypothetical protein